MSWGAEQRRAEIAQHWISEETVARFVNERCKVASTGKVAVAQLWARWADWCGVTEVDAASKKALGQHLERLGFPAARSATCRYRVGLR